MIYPKSIRDVDKGTIENFIEAVYYAQSMETEFIRIQKELTNLQYLNKFLLMTQKKKDDMISYLFGENRALKNELLEMQKYLDRYKSKNGKPQTQNLDGSFYRDSLIVNPKIMTNITSIPSTSNILNPIKKPSPFFLASVGENTISKKRTKVYEDNLAYKNLLNMNLSNFCFVFLFKFMFRYQIRRIDV